MKSAPLQRIAVAVIIATIAATCANDEPPPPAGAAPRHSHTAGSAHKPRSLQGVGISPTLVGRVSGIPTALTAHPGGDELLVSEVTGRIRRIRLRSIEGYDVPEMVREPVVDLSGLTRFDGQNSGLLGIAINPAGDRLFASYTALDGAITVRSWTYAAGKNLSPQDGHILISIPHPFAGLSGGAIDVDRSGALILAVGDMDLRFIHPPSAQDPASPLGSVLRISADEIADRERGAPNLDGTVVAKGLRNPWGLSIDDRSGDVWIADVGDHDREEFNRIPGDIVGSTTPNFGWPYFEGTRMAMPTDEKPSTFATPMLERQHTYYVCSAVGGFVSHDPKIQDLTGAFIYGDLCSNAIRAFTYSGNKVLDNRRVGTIGEKVIQFGQGSDGTMYVLGFNGAVYRLDPRGWRPGDVSTPPPTEPTIDGVVPPGSEHGASTTATTTPPLELCAITDAIFSAGPIAGLSPTDFQAGVERSISVVIAAEAASPESLRDDLALMRTMFEEAKRLGEEAGWNPNDPSILQLQADVAAGRGRFSGIPNAINMVIEGMVGCPGRRL